MNILHDTLQEISCILVDEAQFLTPYQVEELLHITTVNNVPVICYGLRTDFLTHGFPGAIRLMELAHSIEEMKTICSCGKKAIYNARKVNGAFVTTGEQVSIDVQQNQEYVSLRSECYYKLVRKLP